MTFLLFQINLQPVAVSNTHVITTMTTRRRPRLDTPAQPAETSGSGE